jgi:hypothetical protein
MKQAHIHKILLHILATQTHMYIQLLHHYRLNAYHGNAICSHAGFGIRPKQGILNI